MSSGWGCPHEVDGKCQRVNGVPCDPGMKGCVLFGRFVFSDEKKNRPAHDRQHQERSDRKPPEDE